MRKLEILRQLGCRYGQGFGLACPMSEAAATELAEAKVIDIALVQANSLARAMMTAVRQLSRAAS